MSTPIRQLVKKTLSPRIFKSPTSTSFLNSPLFSSDVQLVKSPSKVKLRENKLTGKCFESADLEYSRSLNNKLDEFIIRKPKNINRDENQNKIELNHKLLVVPNHKYVPSMNTPERKEFLKTDLSKLNLNVLGKGSFGTVVQAVYKEANALNLTHPNILHVLLVVNGADANHHLVVMQSCCAPDMQRLIDNSETDISIAVCSKWILDVCSALEYCHQRGILHLDVKPKNILMRNDTSVLCDFGSSLNLNSLEQKKYYLRKVSEGPGGGTVAYSAPELLHGVALPTDAADVYAVGVTMCHVYTRMPPFHNLDSVHSIIYQVVKNNLRPTAPPVQDTSCVCTSSYRSLYLSCWVRTPSLRPTLRTVSDCLQQIITDHQSKCF